MERLRSLTPALIVAAVALIAMAVAFPWGIHLALPLAAFGTAGLILASRPRNRAWRWAGAGSLLWGIEEGVWALVRLRGARVLSLLGRRGSTCRIAPISSMADGAWNGSVSVSAW